MKKQKLSNFDRLHIHVNVPTLCIVDAKGTEKVNQQSSLQYFINFNYGTFS